MPIGGDVYRIKILTPKAISVDIPLTPHSTLWSVLVPQSYRKCEVVDEDSARRDHFTHLGEFRLNRAACYFLANT